MNRVAWWVLGVAACGAGTPSTDVGTDTDLGDTELASDTADTSLSDTAAVTPVYVTFYSHNEDTWGPQVNALDAYLVYRADLVERVNLLVEAGATLNWQSDGTVIEAMMVHEGPALWDDTDGQNILQYMEGLGISIDPHTHTRSMADIAGDMSTLGVTPSTVVGGVKLWECGTTASDPLAYLDWQAEMSMNAEGSIWGVDHPSAQWTPSILSGPAFGGHFYDEMSTGVWRPGSGADFHTHDPAGTLIYVGQGDPHDRTNVGETHASGSLVHYEDAGYIKELLGKLDAGELPAGELYTASLHVRDQPNVDGVVDVNDGLGEILAELQPYVDSGRVIFATYQQVAQRWMDDFDSAPFHVPLDDFEGHAPLMDGTLDRCGL